MINDKKHIKKPPEADLKAFCAVVVAYNNPSDLTSLVSSMEKEQISGLIVVDNSSPNYVYQNRRVLKENACGFSFMKHVISGQNLGSAGGYSLGMDIAYHEGFSWIWLLDQDGRISPGCSNYLPISENTCRILCPAVVSISDSTTILEGFRSKINFFGGIYPFPERLYKNCPCTIDLTASHGICIGREVIERIGIYNSSDFFVGGEDYEYSIRAKNNNIPIILLPVAKVFHPDKKITESKINEQFNRSLRKVWPPYWSYPVSSEYTPNMIHAEIQNVHLFYHNLKSWQITLFFTFSMIAGIFSLRKLNCHFLWNTLKIHMCCLRARLAR